ncbi:MAG: hypothetical protein AAGB19_22365 [Cyanobacteria bacterium P01_F01_bin.3]
MFPFLSSARPSARPVIIHYHIFKNAGTSVDRLLADSFGKRWHTLEGKAPNAVLESNVVAKYVRKHPKLIAISSHTARPPLPDRNYYPILLLRHPIVRIRSVQRFLKQDANQRQHPYAKLGLRHYVEWLLEKKAGMQGVCRNFQVCFLSDASLRRPRLPTETDLEQAKQRLADWPAFGLVNEFSRSMALFNYLYGTHFPDLNLYNRRENVTNPIIREEDEVLADIESEIGSSLYQQIVAANQLDLDLFDFAGKRFSQLLQQLDSDPVTARAVAYSSGENL